MLKPESVRVGVVGRIPLPDDPQLRRIANFANFNFDQMEGMTFNRGIYLTENRRNDRGLLIHELAHVTQWNRLGKEESIRQYIPEILQDGHGGGPLEQEASKFQMKFYELAQN